MGVALVAVFGDGVGEFDGVPRRVPRDNHGAGLAQLGQGERSVVGDPCHGPAVTVPHHLPHIGAKVPEVAAGRHHIPHQHLDAVANDRGSGGVEFPGRDPGGLEVGVDEPGVVVGRRRHRERLAGRVSLAPRGGDGVEVFGEGAGLDAAVCFVGVEDGGVAVSELEGCGGFPRFGEAVDGVELDRGDDAGDLRQQAAAADGLQLARITHQHQTPVLLVGRGW